MENAIVVNGIEVPSKVVTLSYIFRAIKDQKKLDELVAAAASKGTNHVSYEVVEPEDETSDTLFIVVSRRTIKSLFLTSRNCCLMLP